MKPSNLPPTAAAAAPHLRLAGAEPGPGATRFASFAPMNDQPGLADRKASFVLAFSGLLLSTLLFFAPKLSTFLRPSPLTLLLLAAILTVAVLVLAAVRQAYAAFILTAPPTPESLLFFQNIASTNPERYGQHLCAADGHAALRQVLDYNYTMARLGVAKFRLVGRALLCLRIAIPIWMVLLVALGLRG